MGFDIRLLAIKNGGNSPLLVAASLAVRMSSESLTNLAHCMIEVFSANPSASAAIHRAGAHNEQGNSLLHVLCAPATPPGQPSSVSAALPSTSESTSPPNVAQASVTPNVGQAACLDVSTRLLSVLRDRIRQHPDKFWRGELHATNVEQKEALDLLDASDSRRLILEEMIKIVEVRLYGQNLPLASTSRI